MSMTENASCRDVDQREADPVDRNRSLGDHEGGPARVDFKLEEFPFPLPAPFAQDGGRIDMTLDEVSAEAVAHFECAFEVDAIAGLLVAEVGSRQRFGAGLDLKFLFAQRDDGEAAAVDRDALAQFQWVNRTEIGPADRDAAALELRRQRSRFVPALRPIP